MPVCDPSDFGRCQSVINRAFVVKRRVDETKCSKKGSEFRTSAIRGNKQYDSTRKSSLRGRRKVPLQSTCASKIGTEEGGIIAGQGIIFACVLDGLMYRLETVVSVQGSPQVGINLCHVGQTCQSRGCESI